MSHSVNRISLAVYGIMCRSCRPANADVFMSYLMLGFLRYVEFKKRTPRAAVCVHLKGSSKPRVCRVRPSFWSPPCVAGLLHEYIIIGTLLSVWVWFGSGCRWLGRDDYCVFTFRVVSWQAGGSRPFLLTVVDGGVHGVRGVLRGLFLLSSVVVMSTL